MTRRSISTCERARLFGLHGGICHICQGRIDGTREAWDVEHETPLSMGGADDDENRKPVHVKCHKVKTKQMTAYLDAVQRYFADKGVILTDPDARGRAA